MSEDENGAQPETQAPESIEVEITSEPDATDGEQPSAWEDEQQAEEDDAEDDHNYEITDFSMVTPWERLIYEVEEVLRRWGVANGHVGSGWDGEFPATQEHTILNSSGTKGVRHRKCTIPYLGRQVVVRHVMWLPEGKDERTAGVCGIESMWKKRSSAATGSNYVHELGCCHGIANYLILSPDDSERRAHATMQECTLLRSTLAVAMNNVCCGLAGFTPSGPRGTPTTRADFPYTFQGIQWRRGSIARLCCYLDAQASRETAESMRSPNGVVQYMRTRHCYPGDRIKLSVRDTLFLVLDGEAAVPLPSTVNSSTPSDWKSWVGVGRRSCSDLDWGGDSDPMDRLTLELVWSGIDEDRVTPAPSTEQSESAGAQATRRPCGLPLADAKDWALVCQFSDHPLSLSCPLAAAVGRLCGLCLSSEGIDSFAQLWTADDPITLLYKRGIGALREDAPEVVERIYTALEDILPSDPEGYTVQGQCVAAYRPSASEGETGTALRIKGAPPGSLLALLAKHMCSREISSHLRWAGLLWTEFISEVHACPSYLSAA